jgi:hypothetical protein
MPVRFRACAAAGATDTPSLNLVLNCDSHDNLDELTSNGAGESADGFGCHVDAGDTGNAFRGCRAWWNADDGYDFIDAGAACTVEQSWAWLGGAPAVGETPMFGLGGAQGRGRQPRRDEQQRLRAYRRESAPGDIVGEGPDPVPGDDAVAGGFGTDPSASSGWACTLGRDEGHAMTRSENQELEPRRRRARAARSAAAWVVFLLSQVALRCPARSARSLERLHVR